MIILKTDAHLLQIGIYTFLIYQKRPYLFFVNELGNLKNNSTKLFEMFTVTHKSRHVKSKINRSDTLASQSQLGNTFRESREVSTT